jgi:flagellar FliJ protein
MAKAAKGLKTLIRLSKFTVDEKRRTLTALQEREEQILAEIEAAERQLQHEQQVARDDPAAGMYFGRFLTAWKERRAALEQALAAVRRQVEQARDELSEAFRELKTYEVTQANRERREREELDRKEQIFLDEIGQNTHLRRQKAEAAEDGE